MTLYNTESPLSREQRQNVNATWNDILSRFSNLQRQINILAGDNDVDELIQRITDTVNNADATLADLQTALSDASELIGDMVAATTSATEAANAANQATADATQLISDMTALQGDLEQLRTSLEQSITDATQATTGAINATTNANQAAQDAQQATTNADNAANRANDAAYAIEGWGQAVPYQNGTTYSRNNPVTYQGSTYQSLIDDNDSLPTDDTKWIVLARRGLDGQGAVQTVEGELPDPNGDVKLPMMAKKAEVETALATKANNTDLTSLEQTVTTHLDNSKKLNLKIIDYFRQPKISKELFKLTTGVNEFCLLHVDGYYHLFYDDKTQTKYRRATTIEGLESTTDLLSFTGKYPWVVYKDGVWNLWVWKINENVTKHYTSDIPEGPYVFSDDVLGGKADWKPTYDPINLKFVASYKDPVTLRSGVAISDTVNGPWVDLGNVFEEGDRPLWLSLEEADPTIFYFNKIPYMLFAGWDGMRQRIGIVELNGTTYKNTGHPIVLLSPDEVWHTNSGMNKIFSPVFLDDGKLRVFYSQNPSSAVSSGWGYIEVSDPKIIKYGQNSIVKLDTRNGLNMASNTKFYKQGNPILSSRGLIINDSSSGLYGSTGYASMEDFTLIIEFEIKTLPTGYARLCSCILSEGATSGASIGLFINNDKIYYESNTTEESFRVSYTSNKILTVGIPYRVILRKYNGELRLIINGATDNVTQSGGSYKDLKYCEIGMRKNGSTVTQGFNGTIYDIEFISTAIPLSIV